MVTTDAASRQGDEIDADLLRFIQQVANSFTKWDLIRFFHDNPHAADTPDNIARYISRDSQEVERELAALTSENIVRERSMSSVTLYSLTPDPALRAIVERFVNACDDRAFRAKAIRVVMLLERKS